ncbi:MAG: hypothetical protein V4490_00525 [Pseudomonadota bacterium]
MPASNHDATRKHKSFFSRFNFFKSKSVGRKPVAQDDAKQSVTVDEERDTEDAVDGTGDAIPLGHDEKTKNSKKKSGDEPTAHQLVRRFSLHVVAAVGCFVVGLLIAAAILPVHTPWLLSFLVYTASGLAVTWIGFQIAKLCHLWPFRPKLKKDGTPEEQEDASPWFGFSDVKKVIRAYDEECDEMNHQMVRDDSEPEEPVQQKANSEEDGAYKKPSKAIITVKKPHRLLPTELLTASASKSKMHA